MFHNDESLSTSEGILRYLQTQQWVLEQQDSSQQQVPSQQMQIQPFQQQSESEQKMPEQSPAQSQQNDAAVQSEQNVLQAMPQSESYVLVPSSFGEALELNQFLTKKSVSNRNSHEKLNKIDAFSEVHPEFKAELTKKIVAEEKKIQAKQMNRGPTKKSEDLKKSRHAQSEVKRRKRLREIKYAGQVLSHMMFSQFSSFERVDDEKYSPAKRLRRA